MHSPSSTTRRATTPTASSGVNNSSASLRYAGRQRQDQKSSLSGVLKHYDDEERLYNITIPRNSFQLGGYQLKDPTVPRGRNGIDVMERDMREVRQSLNEEQLRREKMMRQEETWEQRAGLETQMEMKMRLLEEQRNAELEADLDVIERNRPYGPYHDERQEAEWRKRQKLTQQGFLQKQISEKAIRDAEEAQHLAAPPSDWEAGLKELDDRIHKAIHGDPALHEHMKALHIDNQPKVVQDTRESRVVKKEQETQPLSREVANFADRILLSEVARRQKREQYKAELDAQCLLRASKKQNDLANNIIIDRSYHFGALERAAPPTPDQKMNHQSTSSSQNANGSRKLLLQQRQQEANSHPLGMNNSGPSRNLFW